MDSLYLHLAEIQSQCTLTVIAELFTRSFFDCMTRLIQTLLKEQLITRDQLNDARDKQLGAKIPLQELLVDMGFISEDTLLDVSSRVFSTPLLQVDDADPTCSRFIPFETARRFGVLPVCQKNSRLILAMSDPLDIMVIDEIRLVSGLQVDPVLASKSQINDLIDRYYQADESVYNLLKNAVEDAQVEVLDKLTVSEDALDVDQFVVSSDQAPVIRAVNLILGDAVKSRATDIHIVPQEGYVDVQYRIDGELRDVLKITNRLLRFIVARIKIMTNLDIAETRKPQDGRARIMINERNIDLRISIVPAFYGEAIGMRILDQKEAKIELDRLGLEPFEYDIITKACAAPQGIILVTGPTGSGKTSTLYSTINHINVGSRNIITIEDPVEYLIDGITQVQVNPFKDVTFPNALRSFLRQDPDVILVGEIRDRETADIAFRASLTGHTVLSTIHTNNSVATITRLFDIGLEPYLVASSLILIIAQRLVKCICSECKQEVVPPDDLLALYQEYIDLYKIKKFYKGEGCKKCNFTGCFGRMAIFELFELNKPIRDLIANEATEEEIYKIARKNGLRSLAESGIAKVAQGNISLDEVSRVIGWHSLDSSSKRTSADRAQRAIAVADDDEDTLRVIEKLLSDAGFMVFLARDGEELVEIALREHPDIILSDVTMPTMNGFRAVEILRSKLETATIPIILLTARQDKHSEIKGIEAGADDYITKPFDEDKLLARVRMLLRRLGN